MGAHSVEQMVSFTAGEDGLLLVVGDVQIRLTPELAAEAAGIWLAYRQGVDHDAEPVCDHCGEAVEPDDLPGSEYWIHRGGSGGWQFPHYTCAPYEAENFDMRIATVNGSEKVR